MHEYEIVNRSEELSQLTTMQMHYFYKNRVNECAFQHWSNQLAQIGRFLYRYLPKMGKKEDEEEMTSSSTSRATATFEQTA